jgi:hypothetical protein
MTLVEIFRMLVTDPMYLFWLPSFRYDVIQLVSELVRTMWGSLIAVLIFKIIGIIK